MREGDGRDAAKDREREQGKSYLDCGSHYGISKKPGTSEIPRNLQGWPS